MSQFCLRINSSNENNSVCKSSPNLRFHENLIFKFYKFCSLTIVL